MGMLFRFTCLDCGSSLELFQGVGMLMFDQDKILETVGVEERQKVENLMERHPDARLSTWYQIFYCPHCERQESHLEVQVTSGEDLIYRSEFSCSACGRVLEREEEIRRLESCPECGSNRILESTGDWD